MMKIILYTFTKVPVFPILSNCQLVITVVKVNSSFEY